MISIVVPVYCAESTIALLVERTIHCLKESGRPFEVVLVDDCSPDNTWKVLCQLKEANGDALRIIRLMYNAGQHNATLCGLSFARGRIIVTMDDDLQHDPQDVPRLVAAIDDGWDVAIGSYAVKAHSAIRNLAGGIVDAVQRRVFRLPKGFQLTSFRAMRRAVAEQLIRMSPPFPYLTAMMLSVATRRTNVPVSHRRRLHGPSNYTLARSVSLALNLLLFYSPYPIYALLGICAAAFVVSVGVGAWAVVRAVVLGVSVPGWASVIAALALFSALTQMSLVLLGIYLMRLYRQTGCAATPFVIAEARE